jgi:hypothetical protein
VKKLHSKSRPKGAHKIWLRVKMRDGADREYVTENDLLAIQPQLASGFLLVEVFDKSGVPRKILALDKNDIESVDVLGTIGCKWTRIKRQ